MYAFDLWRRRVLLLVPLLFLLPRAREVPVSPVCMLPLVLLYLFILLGPFSALEWGGAAAETLLTSVTALCTGFIALMFLLPLQALRLNTLLRERSWPWRWAGLILPLFFCSAAVAASLAWLPPSVSLLDAPLVFAAAVLASAALIRYDELRRGEETENARQLRASLASKEAVLSTLAHEIRTPLTVIKSTADIMQEGRTGPLEPRQREFLGSIISSARRMITFSETILASIKVESTWFSVELQPVDLRPVIKDVSAHMAPFLEEKGQSMRYSFPKLLSRPPADRQWIHQVLVNLVHNASKHLNAGGRVIVSVNENEQCVVVSVSDNGSGIRTAERLRVFEEYFQGDEYSESRLEGSGLGLAIVKRVVEKHNGLVYVSSVKDQGTTVSFTLPKQHESGEGS